MVAQQKSSKSLFGPDAAPSEIKVQLIACMTATE